MSTDWKMQLPCGALHLLRLLYDAGYEGYAVGGCVRDALMGLVPKDYDLCTSASPEEMKEVFSGLRVIETGIQHGTLTVLADGDSYEVTTYRVDGDYADHRHPDSVAFVRELNEDLARRDFTVNAMAYSPVDGLRDCFGGREDLAARRIRCVGEPEKRFDEDALRILRALRFASVYGFSIEQMTAHAAWSLRAGLRHVARERITAEMLKLICGKAASDILREYADILHTVLPCEFHTEGLCTIPAEAPLRLAHLMQDESDVSGILGYLRLDNATAQAVTELIALKDAQEPKDSAAWRCLLRDAGEARVCQLARLKGWNQEGLDGVLARGDCWNLKQLAVTGRDLMQAGIPAGKEVGRALNALLEAVICGDAENEKDALLKYIGK